MNSLRNTFPMYNIDRWNSTLHFPFIRAIMKNIFYWLPCTMFSNGACSIDFAFIFIRRKDNLQKWCTFCFIDKIHLAFFSVNFRGVSSLFSNTFTIMILHSNYYIVLHWFFQRVRVTKNIYNIWNGTYHCRVLNVCCWGCFEVYHNKKNNTENATLITRRSV